MWKYIRKYIPYAVIAALFMACEVIMDLSQPAVMRTIVDDGVLGLANGGQGSMDIVLKSGLLMIGMALFGGICGSMNNVFVNLSGQNLGNDIRKDCFRSVMRFSFPQIESIGIGSLVTRVTNDVTRVQSFVSQMVRGLVRTGLLMIGSFYCMFRIDFNFGLIVLCAFPVTVAFISWCVYKVNPLFPKMQEQLDGLNGIMQEDVAGIRIIKACVRELWEKMRFGKANDELIKVQLKVLLVFALMHPVIHMLMYIVTACILVVGAFDVRDGNCSPGSIMAAITYTTQLLHSVVMLVMIFQDITRGMTSWRRLKVLLDTEPQIKSGDVSEIKVEPGMPAVEFKDVTFGYSDGKSVLSHVSFSVEPGETLAVMGATGCGKSTLVNLIPRFYDVVSGEVRVFGRRVQDYSLEKLRETVGIALQKAEIYSDSVKNNITWGRSDATPEQIGRAASIAQAEQFISTLDGGLENHLAERGMSLSGGQRQRLSLARTVLKDSPIIVFDDATSALDLKTEASFYGALRQEMPDATCIIVAQRIATVRHADRIIVLENGGIAGNGTHEELLENCPAYKDIYDSQMSGED